MKINRNIRKIVQKLNKINNLVQILLKIKHKTKKINFSLLMKMIVAKIFNLISIRIFMKNLMKFLQFKVIEKNLTILQN